MVQSKLVSEANLQNLRYNLNNYRPLVSLKDIILQDTPLLNLPLERDLEMEKTLID